jgi:hypothetical protein
MWRPTAIKNGTSIDYGFGWALGKLRGRTTIGHGGGIFGFSTLILRFVEDRLTVIVLMNGPGDAQALAMGIAARHLPGLTLSSRPMKPDPDAKLTARLKQCLSDLAEKKDSAEITDEFRAVYATTPDRAESLSRRLAGLKEFVYVDHEAANDKTPKRFGVTIGEIRYYKMVGNRETRFYTFELTPDGKVAYYQSSSD